MLEEHKKQCAASVFATVPAGAPTGGSKLGSGSAGGYSGGWVAMPVGADCVLALDNAPYLTLEGSPSKDLVHVSDQPLLTGDECDAIVKSAEKRAAEHGWGSRYTYQTSSHEVAGWQLSFSVFLVCWCSSIFCYSSSSSFCCVCGGCYPLF